MQAAVDDARIAEISIGEAATVDNTLLAEKVSQMRNDLQKLAQRYDSIALTAPVQEGQRPPHKHPHGASPFRTPRGARIVEQRPFTIAIATELWISTIAESWHLQTSF